MKRSKWWGHFLGVLLASSVGSGALAVKPEDCYQSFWRESYDKALVACTELSQQKDGMAYYYLGRMYQKGLGVNQDETQAKKHYKASADLGVDDAKKNLAVMEGQLFFVYGPAMVYEDEANRQLAMIVEKDLDKDAAQEFLRVSNENLVRAIENGDSSPLYQAFNLYIDSISRNKIVASHTIADFINRFSQTYIDGSENYEIITNYIHSYYYNNEKYNNKFLNRMIEWKIVSPKFTSLNQMKIIRLCAIYDKGACAVHLGQAYLNGTIQPRSPHLALFWYKASEFAIPLQEIQKNYPDAKIPEAPTVKIIFPRRGTIIKDEKILLTVEATNTETFEARIYNHIFDELDGNVPSENITFNKKDGTVEIKNPFRFREWSFFEVLLYPVSKQGVVGKEAFRTLLYNTPVTVQGPMVTLLEGPADGADWKDKTVTFLLGANMPDLEYTVYVNGKVLNKRFVKTSGSPDSLELTFELPKGTQNGDEVQIGILGKTQDGKSSPTLTTSVIYTGPDL